MSEGLVKVMVKYLDIKFSSGFCNTCKFLRMTIIILMAVLLSHEYSVSWTLLIKNELSEREY